MDLYTDKKNAEAFSNTRRSNWVGWNMLIKYLNRDVPLKILDIGCGNARFIEWCRTNSLEIESYTGIDYSEFLLNIAKSKFVEKIYSFKKVNLLDSNWSENLNGKYNLIISFGVTHHLETHNSRKNFFDNIYKLADDESLIVITFWNFRNSKAFQRAEIISDKLFRLPFGDNSYRICYEFETEEISKYIERFSVLDKFTSDSKDSKGNLYYVLKVKS